MASALILSVILLDGGAPRPSPSPSPAVSPSPAASSAPTRRSRALGDSTRPLPSPSPSGAATASPSPKVFTNTDLADRDRAAVSTLAAGEGGEPVADPGEAEPEIADRTGNRQDEVYWRNRAREGRERIQAVDQRIVEIEQRLAELRDDVSSQDAMNPFRLQAREQQTADLNRQLEEARADRVKADEEMAAMEDEARRKGVPPGWLRPRDE